MKELVLIRDLYLNDDKNVGHPITSVKVKLKLKRGIFWGMPFRVEFEISPEELGKLEENSEFNKEQLIRGIKELISPNKIQLGRTIETITECEVATKSMLGRFNISGDLFPKDIWGWSANIYWKYDKWKREFILTERVSEIDPIEDYLLSSMRDLVEFNRFMKSYTLNKLTWKVSSTKKSITEAALKLLNEEKS